MHRRRPREMAVYGRDTGCRGGMGTRHSDQHGKEPAGRACCPPHGLASCVLCDSDGDQRGSPSLGWFSVCVMHA